MAEEQKSQNEVEYTPSQLRRVANVYDMLARLIPTEGRDYGVKFIFPDNDDNVGVSVKFEPYNSLGKLWCDYCTEYLRNSSFKR